MRSPANLIGISVLLLCLLQAVGCRKAGQEEPFPYYEDLVYQLLNGALIPAPAGSPSPRGLYVATMHGGNQYRTALFICSREGDDCVYRDLSLDQQRGSGGEPSIALDPINEKVLIAVHARTDQGLRPGLIRCDLDGNHCVHLKPAASANPFLRGHLPVLLVDQENAKLLLITFQPTSWPRSYISLLRCDLDGSSCEHRNISAGHTTRVGYGHDALIDVKNRKLLIADADFDKGGRLGLFRCALDGTSCTHRIVSSDDRSGLEPAMAVDYVNARLYIATKHEANGGIPGLFVCDLDGTHCSEHEITSPGEYALTRSPDIIVDPAGERLLVVATNDANFARAVFYDCNLDGRDCEYKQAMPGAEKTSGWAPTMLLNPANNELLLVASNGSAGERPLLYLCESNGDECENKDISAGREAGSGMLPSIVLN